MPQQKRVIAVDFDGTLAQYDGFKGVDVLGAPVPEMVRKVKQAMSEGAEVWIFTARVNPVDHTWQAGLDATNSVLNIAQWCLKNIGVMLPITHEKMSQFGEIWDDRCQQTLSNTGVFLSELMEAAK